MTLFDNASVFINMTGDKTLPKHKQADIIIKNPAFAENMRDLFSFYWDKRLTVKEFRKRKTEYNYSINLCLKIKISVQGIIGLYF